MQLNDKNKEIGDLRRRCNDLLESKRRNEEEIQALRFDLEHLTNKYKTDLMESRLKLQVTEAQDREGLALKDRELADALKKITDLEHEIRRLLDLNRNYA